MSGSRRPRRDSRRPRRSPASNGTGNDKRYLEPVGSVKHVVIGTSVPFRSDFRAMCAILGHAYLAHTPHALAGTDPPPASVRCRLDRGALGRHRLAAWISELLGP